MQNEAHRLVEECMVAANRCAADFLNQQGQGLFIQHPGLRDDRSDNNRKLLEGYAPHLAEHDASTAEGFKALMKHTEQLEAEVPVKSILSRQLARAELGFEAAPHQGGLAAYTTFTSPLRKFSDFYAPVDQGRALGSFYQGPEQPAAGSPAEYPVPRSPGRQYPETWLKADYARPCRKTLWRAPSAAPCPPVSLCDWIATAWKALSAARLDGKFSFDPVTLRLVHNKNGRIFQLEQRVTVSFTGVDDERRQINFKLLSAEEIPTGTDKEGD